MNFVELIQRAFYGQDNQSRSQAEQQILQLKDTNISQFYMVCGETIEQTSDSGIKLACFILIKRCTDLFNGSNQPYWLECDANVRNKVKQICLVNLLEEDKIMKSAANCIASIAGIEIPHGLWPDILNNLINNSSSENQHVQKAALLTLGYLSEYLKKFQMPELEEQKILYGICQGMIETVQDQEIKKTSIKALQDSLPHMQRQMQQPDVYNYVTNLLLKNLQSKDEQVAVLTLQCLIDFTKVYYLANAQIVETILTATLPFMERDNPEVAIPAMEIWSVLANECRDKTDQLQNDDHLNKLNLFYHNFFATKCQPLLAALCSNLLVNQANEDDAGGLSTQQVSYKALSAIMDLSGDAYHNLFTAFISNGIQHQNWEYKKAGVMAFAILCECQFNDRVLQLVSAGVTTMIQLLRDTNPRVRYAVAEAISKVCENYADAITENYNGQQILDLILQGIVSNSFDIANQLVWAIVYLTEKSKYPKLLEDNKQNILQTLGSIAMNKNIQPSQFCIINQSFMGIMNIMYSIQNAKEQQTYLVQYVNSLDMVQEFEAQRKYHLESGLLSCIHACLVRMSSGDLECINTEQFFKFLIQKEPNTDVLYTLSGFAACLKEKFAPYCEQVLALLNTCLTTKQNEQEIFRSAVYCLGDVARAIEEKFRPYLSVLDFLEGLINDPQFNRELKLQIYICIGDIILGSRDPVYAERMKSLVSIGFHACIQLSLSNDAGNVDYSDRLKESLINFYTCLLHSYCDPEQPFEPLASTVDLLFSFCFHMCNKELHPTVEFVRMALNCMLDVGNFYKKDYYTKIQAYYRNPQFIEISNIMKKYANDSPENQDCVAFCEQMLAETCK